MVTTADGTVSCLDSETGELCHNSAGAYTEALINYAEPSGLIQKAGQTGDIRLLDACYGLGYNTWALFSEMIKRANCPFTLSVIAIEKNPEILSFLPHVLAHPSFDALKIKTGLREHNIYYRTRQCNSDTKGVWDQEPEIVINVADGSRLELSFLIVDLREVLSGLEGDFDAVFHDPFSPQKMPELWTVDIFRVYQRLLSVREGCLLTYSSAAAVRGGLIEAGFTVEKTTALGRKSGGTLGFASQSRLEASYGCLGEEEMAYIATRAGIPYRDPLLNEAREQILQRRTTEQEASDRLPGNSVRNSKRKPSVKVGSD